MFEQKIQKDFVRVIKRGSEEDDDTLFWQTKSPLERLLALEEIRKSYNDWKYGIEQRFHRVYTIIKRQQS